MIQEQDIFNRFNIPSTKESHLVLNGDWFRNYASNAHGEVSDCRVARVIENREVERLENQP